MEFEPRPANLRAWALSTQLCIAVVGKVLLHRTQAADLGMSAYKQDNRTAKSGSPAYVWGI